jgi:hypothetical protein
MDAEIRADAERIAKEIIDEFMMNIGKIFMKGLDIIIDGIELEVSQVREKTSNIRQIALNTRERKDDLPAHW